MACARPVVVTDVGAAAAVVGDGRAGLVVAPKDPEALAVALTRLLTERDTAGRLGATARQLIKQRYDLRETVAAYLELCRAEGRP
jgi:glycosyltransferase involved in cell wall biosynthesis